MAAPTVPQIVVNADKCIKCGACAKECPVKAIKFTTGQNPEPSSGCLECGHCAAVCPVGALCLTTAPIEEFPLIKKELECTPEQVEQLVRSRRSIRSYLPGPVDLNKLNKLLEIIHYAETAGNSQNIEYMVVNTPEKVKQFADHVVDFWLSPKCPMGPQGAKLAEVYKKGYDLVFRGAPCLIIALCDTAKAYAGGFFCPIDGSIAITTAELVAPSLGLGTCWAGFFQSACAHWEPLQKELGGMSCVGAIMVGEPNVRYHRCVPRHPLKVKYI